MSYRITYMTRHMMRMSTIIVADGKLKCCAKFYNEFYHSFAISTKQMPPWVF